MLPSFEKFSSLSLNFKIDATDVKIQKHTLYRL